MTLIAQMYLDEIITRFGKIISFLIFSCYIDNTMGAIENEYLLKDILPPKAFNEQKRFVFEN